MTCSTFTISENETPGLGLKGFLLGCGEVNRQGAVILDSMLETTASDKRGSCSLLKPSAGTGAAAGADACFCLELGTSTRATFKPPPPKKKTTFHVYDYSTVNTRSILEKECGVQRLILRCEYLFYSLF